MAKTKRKTYIFDLELTIKNCSKVFIDGRKPGVFRVVELEVDATPKERESVLFTRTVANKMDEWLEMNVEVVPVEIT